MVGEDLPEDTPPLNYMRKSVRSNSGLTKPIQTKNLFNLEKLTLVCLECMYDQNSGDRTVGVLDVRAFPTLFL